MSASGLISPIAGFNLRQKAAVAAIAIRAVRQVFWPSRREHRWTDRRDVGATHLDMSFDIPTAMFSLAARDYASVAEIGADDARRIMQIKQSNPDIEAYALDIAQNYRDAEIVDGIRLLETNAESVRTLPGETLICSVGTLYLMSPEQIEELFSVSASRRHSIMLFEPSSLIEADTSFPCTTISGGYYHPYAAIARRYGMSDVIPPDAHWKATARLKDMERWGYALFKPN